MEWDGGVCVTAMVMGTGARAGTAEGSVWGVLGRDPMIVRYGWRVASMKGIGEGRGEGGIPMVGVCSSVCD